MRYDLKKPCKNCPFRTDKTRITFASRERAEEIEETAYRHGFPCHKSAEFKESDDYGNDGYYAGENTQHCAGAIIMYLNDDEYAWPGVDNDEELVERLRNKMDMKSPVFMGPDAFLDANSVIERRKRK